MLDFIKNLFKPGANLSKLVQDGAVIVDVRTKSEYQAGHIKGSRNIPLDHIKNGIKNLQKLNKPIITVCRSGSRSGMAKTILAAAGLEVYNGGGWMGLNKQLQ
jgi:phage shock protein E